MYVSKLQLRARPSGQSSAGNINQGGLERAAAHTARAFIPQDPQLGRQSQPGAQPRAGRAQHPSVLRPARSGETGESQGEGRDQERGWRGAEL